MAEHRSSNKADRLIRSCQNDTGVLSSALGWFDEEIEKVQVRIALEDQKKEIYRLQGEARGLRKLRDNLARMARTKGEDEDGAIDQQRTGKNVRRISS